MALTDTAVRQARPAGKDYKISDSDGLALLVRAGGGKAWDFRFYWASDQLRISLGTYPEVSLKEARERRDQARALIAKGIDPRVHRRQARQPSALGTESTFEGVFGRWRNFKALSLKTGRQSTLSQIDRIFAKDVHPGLRQISVFDITRMDLLDVVRGIERRKAFSTAEKTRTWFNQLFRYAMVEFGLGTNPAADLDIVAAPRPPVRHNPFLRMADMPAFLKALGVYGGALNTQLGLRLLLLTGVRTGELRPALPEQFDLERGLWIIPPVVVKQLQRELRESGEQIPPYIVPLSRQAIAIVQHLLNAMPPAQRYLLSQRSDLKERISENTLNSALKRMGYADQLTGHGIRATISTALNELDYRPEWIEAQLSHADPNQVRAAYNHAEYVEQRRKMMQDWADRLDRWELEGQRGDGEPSGAAPTMLRDANQQPRSDPRGHEPLDASLDRIKHGRDAMPVAPVLTIISRRDQRPQPILTDVQRERAAMLAIFESPQNLPLPVFAKLAGKSRDQINREIKSRRLLSLTFGNRGHRIPEWQLDPVRQQFTRAVLERVQGVESWTLYRVLSEAREGLLGGIPVKIVTLDNFDGVLEIVCADLTSAPGARSPHRPVSLDLERKTDYFS